MDFEKRTATSEWLSKSESSTDLSIILRVSMKYADCNNEKHTKHQLIELYKVCYEMASLLKDHVTEKTVCHKLGFLCHNNSRLTDALDYHMKHLRLSKESGDITGEGKAYGNIGIVYERLGQYEKALEYYMNCLRISKENGKPVHEGLAYRDIGSVYERLGQYEKAIEYYMKCLRISEEKANLPDEGLTYWKIGSVYQRLYQHDKAIEYYMKCLCICKEKRELQNEGMTYRNIGIVYESLGQYEEAMEYHMKDLYICQKTGNLTEEGNAHNNIGVVYQHWGQYKEALESFMKQVRICKGTGDRAGEGKAYGNIGVVYKSLGQYEKAMECHMKCLRVCKGTGDLTGEGNAYGNIGVVYHVLGQYEKAMEYYMKCLRVCKDTGDLTGEGTAYGNIGAVCHSLSQYEKAMEYHTKGLCIHEEAGDLQGEVRAYHQIGIVYESLGQNQKAMEYYVKCLPIFIETGNRAEEGYAYKSIGSVYASLGQYEKAMEYYMKCLPIFKETGNRAEEGKAYCNIGVVYCSLGQYGKAMECYMKCLPIFKETGNRAEEGKAYGNIGVVYVSLGQYEKALEYLMKCLPIFKETGNRAEEGKAYGNIGAVYASLGQYEKAMEYNLKGLRIYKEIGDLTGKGNCFHRIGTLCYRNGDINRAEASLKESLRCYQEVFKLIQYQDDYKVSIVDTYIRTYQLLTHVLIESGKGEEALLVSERGRSQALRDKLIMNYGLPKGEEISDTLNEGINSLVTSNDSSFLLFSLCCRVTVFVIEEGKELCLRVRSPGSFAFCANSDHCCSCTKLRKLIELYVNKISQDATKHVNAKYKLSCEDRSMNQDQNKYPDQQLTLDDVISADDVEIVTTRREEALEDDVTTCVASDSRAPTDQSDQDSPVSEPPSKQAQASQLVFDTTTPESKHEMHSELPLPSSTKLPKEEDGAFSKNSTVTNQRNAHQNGDDAFVNLYEALIAPVEEALTKPEIVIIPEGPLFFVPFAALKDKSGHFLSETKRIRLAPSLTTLKLLKECPAEKHSKQGALIVGGPEAEIVIKYRGEKMWFCEFGDLPGARKEADMVGEVLGEKALTGCSATKDEFQRRLKEGVAIIHIATHGKAATGELLFAPGPSAGSKIPKEKKYMLTVEEVYSSGINAQLVVLSCCHSGRGKIKAEGVVGLTRAFLAAGARSVLATLWAVDDEATFYFMKSFYQHLKSGESASASLQQAMKEMRKKPEWSHPYYWAPFFIVGDDIRITT